MEHRFSIAGVTWRVLLPEGAVLPGDTVLREFEALPETGWDHTLEYMPRGLMPEPEGTLIYRGPGMWIYAAGDTRMRYEGPEGQPPEGAWRCIRRQGDRSLIYTAHASGGNRIGGKEILNAIEAEHQIVRRDGFLLHASWIRWRDRAILFTAPSGTGKSTQAELWHRLRGAELINGDRAAVFTDASGVPQVRGIPFSGSSGVGKNVRMPLAAVVYLSQAPATTIAPLRGYRAFRKVWEGCCVNLWDREDVERCAETVTRVLGQVPVYHLACTPDESAVLALEECLKEGW